MLLLAVCHAAWLLSPPTTLSPQNTGIARGHVRMDSSWRPKTVDPLGKAFGTPAARARTYSLWLDLRGAENTFAQMVLVKLFYAVRRIVDEAGKSLPSGSKVEGMLFDGMTYDRADTIGADHPIFVDNGAADIVNATLVDVRDPLTIELRQASTSEELDAAQAELAGLGDADVITAIALPADAMLWAEALTGLKPSQLECVDEGA